MEKSKTTVIIQMPCYLVNTLNGCNRENYRDILVCIPREWLNLKHKKNKDPKKECDRNQKDNTDWI